MELSFLFFFPNSEDDCKSKTFSFKKTSKKPFSILIICNLIDGIFE